MVYAIRDLTKEQLAALVPFGVACALVGYGIRSYVESKKGGHCNLSVRKNESKVVDSIDMEDLGDKASLCRCWRSAKFPYCDGTHNKHNETTGDNVGPLVIKKKGK